MCIRLVSLYWCPNYIFVCTRFRVSSVLRVVVFIYVWNKFASELNKNLKEIKFEGFRKNLLKLLLCWLLFNLTDHFKKFFSS
jgi:hypothetical protein